MRFGGVLTVLAACSHSSHHSAVDATATPPGDAFVPTESRPLGLNDVSILIPLPAAVNATTLVRTTGFVGGSELVSRDLFAHVVGTVGDVTNAYEDFHLVAIRFDLCERAMPVPCASDADGRLRLVFQPVATGGAVPVVAQDVALHAFYPIPNTDLAWLVDELRALARLQNFQTASPLAVNPTLSSTAPPSAYAKRLQALLERYASADRIARLTLFAQDARVPPFTWVFRGAELAAGVITDMTIPTISAVQQRVSLVEYPSGYDTSPVADQPAGFQLALNSQMFADATYADRQQSLAALAAAQNPTSDTMASQQCVACHVSTFLTASLASSQGVAVASIPGTYTSPRALSIGFGISASNAESLRAFGWFGQYPAISQRVANESAMVVDEMEQRFPPAATTTLLDAAVPDSPITVKRVFLLSEQHDADLKTAGGGSDGLDGADRLCAAGALRGHLGGSWVAWLSSSTVNAIDRLTGNGPWYLVDGTTLVFPTKAAIASGPMHAIDHDEQLATPADVANVWTGTGTDGRVDGSHTCVDWTSNNSNPNVVTGASGLFTNTDAGWTDYALGVCSTNLFRLYCFEQ